MTSIHEKQYSYRNNHIIESKAYQYMVKRKLEKQINNAHIINHKTKEHKSCQCIAQRKLEKK